MCNKTQTGYQRKKSALFLKNEFKSVSIYVVDISIESILHKQGYGKLYPEIASTKPQTVHAEEVMECNANVNARCAVIHFEKKYFFFHSALNF